MGRAPFHACCEHRSIKKGAWTDEEDNKLLAFIQSNHGHGTWRTLPKLAGLQRCGRSCRMRWKNYLQPGIKRGGFSAEEDRLIVRLQGLLGNRWSTIASHLPGRTDNEVKNYWRSHLKKRLYSMRIENANEFYMISQESDQAPPSSQAPIFMPQYIDAQRYNLNNSQQNQESLQDQFTVGREAPCTENNNCSCNSTVADDYNPELLRLQAAVQTTFDPHDYTDFHIGHISDPFSAFPNSLLAAQSSSPEPAATTDFSLDSLWFHLTHRESQAYS